jgi:hypothetical protein
VYSALATSRPALHQPDLEIDTNPPRPQVAPTLIRALCALCVESRWLERHRRLMLSDSYRRPGPMTGSRRRIRTGGSCRRAAIAINALLRWRGAGGTAACSPGRHLCSSVFPQPSTLNTERTDRRRSDRDAAWLLALRYEGNTDEHRCTQIRGADLDRGRRERRGHSDAHGPASCSIQHPCPVGLDMPYDF